jgi:hypothetical protein
MAPRENLVERRPRATRIFDCEEFRELSKKKEELKK